LNSDATERTHNDIALLARLIYDYGSARYRCPSPAVKSGSIARKSPLLMTEVK
jgi:hypothetical protein